MIFDYEYANGLPFIKPMLGIVPEVVNRPSLSKKFKVGSRGYNGLKEDVYVASFKPNPQVLQILGISEDQMVVTIRPPASEAHYHNPESEQLFEEVVNYIGNFSDSVMVILPRNEKSQKQMIIDIWPQWYRERKIIIPEQVVNGLDLIWYSDFVISGGGTMNREAAALGVPTYSIFRGKIGAVDKYLSKNGRLTLLESVADVKTKINPVKRIKSSSACFRDLSALNQIVDAIDSFAASEA